MFKLKPKGVPILDSVIDKFIPPSYFTVLFSMPVAKMKTLHTFENRPNNQTAIIADITITGPVNSLWGRKGREKHASGLPGQTEHFIEAARKV